MTQPAKVSNYCPTGQHDTYRNQSSSKITDIYESCGKFTTNIPGHGETLLKSHMKLLKLLSSSFMHQGRKKMHQLYPLQQEIGLTKSAL